jgi:hypothetical protein
VGLPRSVRAAENLETHSFDSDPAWEKFGETAMGGKSRQVTQDFGWRPTNKAGGAAPGEIGGVFGRSLTRAVYWMKIPEKTTNDKLSISGRFAVPRTDNDSGMQIGFFHETSTGWRTPNSLVFRLSGEDKKEPAWEGKWVGQFSWAFVDFANRNVKASGIGALDGNVYQNTKTPPIYSDGKSHEFAIAYDPAGAGGNGEVSITIDGKTWTGALEPGQKTEGATFNRVGFMNLQTSGNGMEFYCDDLRVNGELIDFTKDPGWEADGNKASFEDRDIRPYHDLRWSKTNFAGGQPGEIAVTMWRDERPAYYAAPVRKLTQDDELHAEGRLAFTGAGSDSGVLFGWFNSESKKNHTTPDYVKHQRPYLAIAVEGPSRIGHYFRPMYASSGEARGDPGSGPIIRPDSRQRRWTLDYDPKAADGKGRITVTLDNERVEFDLTADARKAGATFDRFGFFDLQAGGHHVKIFVDDLKYTGSVPR